MFACDRKFENELELKEAGPAGVENVPGIEDLLERAYQIHRQHGGIFGYDLGDWLQAERELAVEHNNLSASSSEPVEASVSH